jgi:hypothetical protein
VSLSEQHSKNRSHEKPEAREKRKEKQKKKKKKTPPPPSSVFADGGVKILKNVNGPKQKL